MTNDVLRELEAELRRELTELNQAVYEHNDGCPAQNRAIAARDKVKARLDAISALRREREWRPIKTAPEWLVQAADASPPKLGQHICKTYTDTNGVRYVVEFEPVGRHGARLWLPLPIPTEEPEK